MTDMFEAISKLTAAFGPSGQEQPVSTLISAMARPYADEIACDTMGNLIVHKKGSGPKLMLAAHMDTIGLVVTYIEDDGALRVGKLGGVSPKEIRNAPVCFASPDGHTVNGTVKVHGKADESKLTVDDLYVDIGAGSREEAQRMVRLGDAAVFAANAMPAGNRIISPYLDNRVSCAVLLKALEEIRESVYDLYFVFTVQEELGTRGAKTAAYGIDPDYAIAVDVTNACDWPGASKTGSAVLGGGAAIKVMDASVISHPEMVERLSKLAQENGIKAQLDVLTKGGTDAGAIHQSRNGVITGGISIPCRYVHTPTSMVDLSDVAACVDLVTTFVKNM